MDPSDFTPSAHTPFADLDLLLSEAEQGDAPFAVAAGADVEEPETVDAFNAQILAGLVSP